jgi:hypothetical protein
MKNPFATHRSEEERCAMVDGFLCGLIVMSVAYCVLIAVLAR